MGRNYNLCHFLQETFKIAKNMTDANKKILQIFSILQILEHAKNKTPDLRYFQVMAFVQRDLSNMLGSVLKEININLFKVIYMSAFVPGW